MKDRSFAYRIHQSNIDRQRNQAIFANRGVAYMPPEPDYWAIFVAFVKRTWAKVRGFLRV